MDEETAREILAELLSTLEPMERQNYAVLNFMKAKGIATDEELAPFLEQAGNASDVRWRAVRVRMESLISSAFRPPASSESAAPKADGSATEAAPQDQNDGTPGKAQKSDVEKQQSQKPVDTAKDPEPAERGLPPEPQSSKSNRAKVA